MPPRKGLFERLGDALSGADQKAQAAAEAARAQAEADAARQQAEAEAARAQAEADTARLQAEAEAARVQTEATLRAQEEARLEAERLKAEAEARAAELQRQLAETQRLREGELQAERFRAEMAEMARSARAAMESRAAAGRTYTVQAGDTLSGIALAMYSDASRWPDIFEANRDKISDPNLIYPGQELTIP